MQSNIVGFRPTQKIQLVVTDIHVVMWSVDLKEECPGKVILMITRDPEIQARCGQMPDCNTSYIRPVTDHMRKCDVLPVTLKEYYISYNFT